MSTISSSLLAKFLAARELERKEFPLSALLTLYFNSQTALYLNHFEGFKLLVKWLGPISRSKFSPIAVPACFSTYECQALGAILEEHSSVIYQELYSIWTHSTTT